MKQVTLTNGYDFTYDTIRGAVSNGAVHNTGLMAEASFGITFLVNHREAADLFRRITADSRPDIKVIVERTIETFPCGGVGAAYAFETDSPDALEVLVAVACLAGVVQTEHSRSLWAGYQAWCTAAKDLTGELGAEGWDETWASLASTTSDDTNPASLEILVQNVATKRLTVLMLDTLAQVYIDHFGIDLDA